VWSREIDGLRLTFHLAGINNQNFLMRDEETGTYWQQISGAAISGPLNGRQLELVHSDELTFATWRAEQPRGTILADVAKYTAEYSPKDWDVRMKRAPTVVDFRERGLKARDLMLGIRAFGASRAWPYERVISEKLIQDRLGSVPVLIVVGGDNQSVRAFRTRLPGVETGSDFYRLPNTSRALLMDAATGSEWNFQGCAVTGRSKGICLEPVPMLKDYWFDWRNYNPQTSVYGVQ